MSTPCHKAYQLDCLWEGVPAQRHGQKVMEYLENCKQGLGLLELELEALLAGLHGGSDSQDAVPGTHGGNEEASVLQLVCHNHAELPGEDVKEVQILQQQQQGAVHICSLL